MSSPKIWLITGVSSGFGECLAEEVVKSGGIVAGTLRKPGQVREFSKRYEGKGIGVRMDVTRPDEVAAGVAAVLGKYKRIDVLVNNAGYGFFGAVEETSEQEARDQMETNFFGALWVTQAVLPQMRKQRSGHILQISSVGGLISIPGLGLYHASKHALEGFSKSLAQEGAPLGIKVTLVEPGPFRTEWAGGSSKVAAKSIVDYEATAHATMKQIQGYSGNQPGDPVKAAQAIIRVVEAQKPPLHLPLGQIAIDRIREKLRALEQEISDWEDISVNTAFAA